MHKLHFFLHSIAKILEAGLMTRWKQIYWLPEDACSVFGGVGSGSTTVKVTDMQSSFYILGLGNHIFLDNLLFLSPLTPEGPLELASIYSINFSLSGSVLGVLIFMIESALRKSKESREVSVVKPFLA